MHAMDAIVYNLMPRRPDLSERAASEDFGTLVLGLEEHLVRMPSELFYCLEEAAQRMELAHLQELLALVADQEVVGVKVEVTLKAKSVRFTLDGPVEGEIHE